LERVPVSRKSLFALGVALAIGSISPVAAPAHAHSYHGRYWACVTARPDAWLHLYGCRHHWCLVPVDRGRAFRVERQRGDYLLVRNLEIHGWIELDLLRFAPQAYCRAAGI
jgi:hypothetical protein